MSILSTPMLADALARLFAVGVRPGPMRGVRFPEIPGRTTLIKIPTRHGDVAATVYHPAAGEDRPAVYVNVHGGGFVVGHREQDDPWCRFLAAHANVVVVNVDYLLAPHHRFPTPAEQIYDVLSWVSKPDHGWDGSRLCVGGQSAGGSLSAAAARLALEGGGPSIALQVLHYPPLDLVTATKDKHSPSGAKAVLKPWMGEVFDTAYIPDRARRTDRLASPAWGANADGIEGIAPALIVTAEYDRLRDEAWQYAQKLDAVGALAEYYEVPDVDHGYNIMSNNADVTRKVYEHIAGHVRRATAP
ncbi:putative lipase/esterase [Mycolicibacterium fortuitum]|uniref:Putative lipase/esterase n=1 Tax=Mycolicibacterium fortuitum TaxID=1766 RepID=A0A0N9YIQ6_MYCFO|nr:MULTISPECIES: alpha/beta hydrolase fold domain-containing protein [Mycolicibacterium]ALI29760.1 putative lipase/esterase [Mycolicibacterium fortuitum]MBP3083025.1 alpha/beta hydrolase fold domain-containing protein [Mycolicibacterium fortuitum]MCA4721355.1 alpha/beta hydrolase fold domain-containing protein [Mycolicibacterium fortuitum]MCA4756292.1 alpha/beta hydrolase fold domain-containing protein [Mycolicibacterium fortuitum]MDG5770430.1 alpha/beta hydrolase fold domain-containing protei